MNEKPKGRFLEFSIYSWKGKRYPRFCITDAWGGTRLYGDKFNDFPTVEEYKIPLTLSLIEGIRKELNDAEKALKIEDERNKEASQ
jgi:hypothetical protein